MEDRKNVLLIGSTGNIGQNLAKKLIKKYNVYCLIRSNPNFGINSIFLKFIDGDATK
jgi:nucleoside-diphosphate-sugar epimerase